MEATFDHAHCQSCEGETKLVWTTPDQPPRTRVRELNDAFRREGRGHGSIVMTRGIHNLGDGLVAQTVAAVQGFTEFSEDNDPWGEHDFGAVVIDSNKVFWKIDYYDQRSPMVRRIPAMRRLPTGF